MRLNSSKIVDFEAPVILANENYRFIVRDQIADIGLTDKQIILEPVSRNTAPAILAATLKISEQFGEEAILLVSPTDHIIGDNNALCETLALAAREVQSGNILVFGIEPTYPETGYGYLKVKRGQLIGVCELTQFIEKPEAAEASNFLSDGSYLWNSGMLVFRAGDMLQAFKRLEPELFKHVLQSLKGAHNDLDFLRLKKDTWSMCRDISIDYAIMERIENRACFSLNCSWNDLGTWNSVWEESRQDENGVSKTSDVISLDCTNVLLYSETSEQSLVGIGLNNLIAVAMKDAVLIANKDHVQDVKTAVAKLEKSGARQITFYPKSNRIWGICEELFRANNIVINRLSVKPKHSIKMQQHLARSEHWIVVSGCAHINKREQLTRLVEGESTFTSPGEVHELQNREDVELELIEIQFGDVQKENDII